MYGRLRHSNPMGVVGLYATTTKLRTIEVRVMIFALYLEHHLLIPNIARGLRSSLS